MRIIQFIIPWSTLISSAVAQINNAASNTQTYPIDTTFYNHFLTNQAQLNQALLMPNNLLPTSNRLPSQQAYPNFHQQNLGLPPNNVDLFNQQLQNFNQLPSQSFFDPLTIPQPITDIKLPTVITPTFVVPQQRQTESYLGGIPSPEHRNSRALTVKSFVGIDKSITSSTISPSTTTTKSDDSEQVRLIRKLLEETLAVQRSEQTSTSMTTTIPVTSTTEKVQKSSIVPVTELGVLDRLNLNETEKKAIVARVEELLRVEIARKLQGEVSTPSPSSTTTESTTTSPSSTTSSTTTPSSTSPLSTTESTSTVPSTTIQQIIETTTASQPPTISESAPTAALNIEKKIFKSLALKQKKSSQVGGRSIVRPVTLSESIDEPITHLRVSTVQKEIRESQPRLPSRYIHNTKKDFDEDLDLIDRSGVSDRRADTAAAASLLTSARRIAYPQDYEEIRGEKEKIRQTTANTNNDFFQPVTGAPLDLSDVYDEEEGGIVQLNINERRKEQLRAIATASPFSLRTTARPFHDETTSTPLPPSSPPSDPLNLETVTTPPFRNGRHGHRATKFEVLASDYRSRLGEAGDLGLILKRLSQNAYIALIESDGGRRTRHESRRSNGRQ